MVLAEAVGLLGDSVEALVDNDPAARPAIEGVPLLAGEAGLRRWLDARGGGSGVVGSVAIGGGRGADRLVIAAGPWAPDLLAGLGLPLRVERRVLVWFDPVGGVHRVRERG